MRRTRKWRERKMENKWKEILYEQEEEMVGKYKECRRNRN
jgi:hypothetical protein